MKIVFSGPAHAYDSTERPILDEAILNSVGNLTYEGEPLVEYLDGRLSDIGLEGGTLQVSFDKSRGALRVTSEYGSPRRLRPSELRSLLQQTVGQWSDGVGEGAFDDYSRISGIRIDVYPMPYDRGQVVVEQIDDGRTIPGRSPLLAAARVGDVGKIERLLPEERNLECLDQWGHTPLMTAVAGNHTEAALLLIDAGANVNHVAKNQTTCASLAAMNGNCVILRALIAAGADAGAHDDCGATPLAWAANRSHLEAIDVLLDAGVDPDARDLEGRTALMYALDLAVVSRLLDRGADSRIKSTDGLTAAEEASRQANLERWLRVEVAEKWDAKAEFLRKSL